jgi:penicillin amidase
LQELEVRLGKDVEQWTWGRLHQITFAPAVATRAASALRSQMTIGPFPLDGSGSTPAVAGYEDNFEVSYGAGIRMVIDVGAWDKSVIVNAPGQSGDPFSSHYRDHAELWASGGYVPLLYSREAINSAAETVMRLIPGR